MKYIIPRHIMKGIQQVVISAQQFLNSDWFKQFLSSAIYYGKVTDRYWPITDQRLIRTLSSISQEGIEKTILEFYSQENYFEIQQMVTDWQKYSFLTERMPILNSCLNVLLSNISDQDKNNIIIPTLMAQLSGLKESLYEYVPQKERKTIEKDLRQSIRNSKEKLSSNEILLQFLHENHLVSGYILLELNQIIFDRAFARREKISKLDFKKYNKFRNKILHGDINFLDYGTKINMIRAWLEVNFLVILHNEIQKNLKLRCNNKI